MIIPVNLACPSKESLDWVGPLLLAREEIIRIPRKIPGVYIIHEFVVSRGTYPALYVGKSNDLRRRILQHLNSNSTSDDLKVIRRHIALRFSAAPAIFYSKRAALEAGLIRLLRPPCNRQVPDVAPMYPDNLPPMALSS